MMNKRYFPLLILALALPIAIFAQQWTDTNALPAGRYDDIYFHNADLGWAVNGSGLILKTENGGDTWTDIFSNSLP